MTQLDLFDRPIARRTDPQASHEAAAVIAPKLGLLKSRCLKVLTGEMTACEIARDAAKFGGFADSYRKRIHELKRDGLIETCGTRECSVTGIKATVYRLKGE